MARPPVDLPALTSLRFYAALWVVMYHYADQISVPWEAVSRLLHRGPLAVDFFFALSGFILAHVYASRIRTRRLGARNFLKKRLLRIYPLHVVTILALVAIFALTTAAGVRLNSPDKYDLYELPKHLLLVHAWGTTDHHSWNIPSWSISAEWAAYLLFPFLAPALFRLRASGAVVLGAVCLVGTAAVCELALGWRFLGLQTLGVVRVVPEFILGITLWMWWSERWEALRTPPWLASMLALLVVGVASSPRTDFATLALLMVALPALAMPLPHALLSRPFQYLGHASFSLYMTHGLTQTVYFYAVRRLGHTGEADLIGFTVWGIGVLLAIAVSVAAHELVEKPLHRVLGALVSRPNEPLAQRRPASRGMPAERP